MIRFMVSEPLLTQIRFYTQVCIYSVGFVAIEKNKSTAGLNDVHLTLYLFCCLQ